MSARARSKFPSLVRLFSCNHWSSHFPDPVSQPLRGNTGLVHRHACERCVRHHAEQRGAAIMALYSPEKRELEDRIEQLRRTGPIPRLSVMHARDQLMLARSELYVLEI